MKSDIAISFMISKSLFFGFILSYILNTTSYLSFISIFIGYFLGYFFLNNYMNKKHKLNNILLFIIDIVLLLFILFNLSYQANNFFLKNTPTIFIIILFGTSKKLDGLSNLVLILLPINIILILLGIIFNIENYNIISINNINILSILLNILITLIISIIPIIIYINTNDNYNKKHILTGYILSGLVIIITSLNCIFTNGPTIISNYYFIEYITYKKIHLLDFIERIENIISVYSLLDFIVLGIIILLNIKNLFYITDSKTRIFTHISSKQ